MSRVEHDGFADEARAWADGAFQIASPFGIETVHGYVWRGLGIFQTMPGSPKGRRKPRWSLTHLGSGHSVGYLTGDVRTAFPVASEIALAGDWTFDGLTGWKNQFPDISERVAEIAARCPNVFCKSGGGRGADEASARAIAIATAA